MPGSLILLNGASSAGKSSLARAAQALLPLPFWHYSIDHLAQAEILPWARIRSGEFPWSAQREAFFAGFHNSLPALLQAGNHLLVEHILESEAWRLRLQRLLQGHDVFVVALHCPLAELERRERARGDRRLGEAREDFGRAHAGCAYDLELSGLEAPTRSAQRLLAAWQARPAQRAWARAAQTGSAST
jgi:chloramphenicol 3-O phosphotransferase